MGTIRRPALDLTSREWFPLLCRDIQGNSKQSNVHVCCGGTDWMCVVISSFCAGYESLHHDDSDVRGAGNLVADVFAVVY